MRRKRTRHYGSHTTKVGKSGRMAFTGRTDGDSDADEDVFANTASEPAIPSSVWEHHGRRFQDLTGVRINPEHGKDVNVMKWRDGRDPAYIFTLAIFVALQVPTALVGNLVPLLEFYFLTGFFGSPSLRLVGSFPIVFGEIHQLNLGHLGLAFLGILVAALLTIPPYYW
ncbi:hypothetical protein CNMCM8927_003856 [Aspergillus lentulus]|uniref:Uncharacterized protein n=1 Tax=Aspergillus lentulus TaxID=293939 RepID=A0AAN5YEL5_ASPLE|nr:hypothetical protein CNMCM7927_003588 [Aspergillus lentulus]KAF4200149.1 hypothetical protein CNMCM8927_003856 [Aspergillus lentulus]